MAQVKGKKNNDEEEPVELIAYDSEVELKRIDAEREVQAGWQKIVKDNVGTVIGIWERGKKIEYQSVITISRWTYISIVIFFLVISGLTYVGKVSGDSLAFLTGIVTGYMLSLISAKPKREYAR